jgi:hypothetical protein
LVAACTNNTGPTNSGTSANNLRLAFVTNNTSDFGPSPARD